MEGRQSASVYVNSEWGCVRKETTHPNCSRYVYMFSHKQKDVFLGSLKIHLRPKFHRRAAALPLLKYAHNGKRVCLLCVLCLRGVLW